MPSMSILILGATGASGVEFIRQALSSMWISQLRLLIRTPEKLSQEFLNDPRIHVVVRVLSSWSAVDEAMHNVIAVVSFLGDYITLPNILTRNKNTPIADSMPVVLNSMRSHGVKRVLALSTPGGVRLEADSPSWTCWFWTYLPPEVVVPAGNAEMNKIAALISSQDDLEWTIFRVPQLVNTEEKSLLVSAYLEPERDSTLRLSRTGLAGWTL